MELEEVLLLNACLNSSPEFHYHAIMLDRDPFGSSLLTHTKNNCSSSIALFQCIDINIYVSGKVNQMAESDIIKPKLLILLQLQQNNRS